MLLWINMEVTKEASGHLESNDGGIYDAPLFCEMTCVLVYSVC